MAALKQVIQGLLAEVKGAASSLWDAPAQVQARRRGSSSDEGARSVFVDLEMSPVLPRYATQEEANQGLVRDYVLYIKRHLGRAPAYHSDLYCCMAPVGVSAHSWWMPPDHPLAFVLRSSGTDCVAEMTGSHRLVAYTNHDVECGALQIAQWFESAGHELKERDPE